MTYEEALAFCKELTYEENILLRMFLDSRKEEAQHNEDNDLLPR